MPSDRCGYMENARLYRADFTDVRIDQETQFDGIPVAETAAIEREDASDGKADFTATTWAYRELQRLYEENAMPARVEATV